MKPHNLIVASAGSGKTHQLTRHFIEILFDGMKRDDGAVIERILAATFTRAAAGEIAQRILMRLADAATDGTKRGALGVEINCGDLSDEQCIKLLQTLVRRLSRLRICTLDSFLVRSAQGFAPELGLAFPWTILDDQADRLLRLEAIDALLTDAAKTEESFDAMKSLLIDLHQGHLPMRVRERLVDHFARTYDLLQAGPPAAWDAIAPDADKLMSSDALVDLLQTFDADVAPHLPRTKKGDLAKRWADAAVAIRDAASGGEWEKLAGLTLVAKILDGASEYDRHPITVDVKEILTPLIDHAGASLLQKLHDKNRSTRDLLQKFDHHYRLSKSRRSAYQFGDFTSLLIDAGVVRPELLTDFYYRLDGRIDHILLDEFQDTSIPQWKLMEPLVDEIMSGQGAERHDGGSRSFFCVGDIKQTLYSWRNAEPKLLGELSNRWPQLKRELLLESRRSSMVIIDTVNHVFADLSNNPALPASEPHLAAAAAEWDEWFDEHDTVHKDMPGFARLFTCEAAPTPSEMQLNAMKLAASRAAELSRAMPGKTIAILLRRKKFINQIIYQLTHKHSVECSGEGGSPLIDDPAVCVALSMLQLIEHPSDSAAAYHVGTSPLGEVVGLTDESETNDVLRVTRPMRREIMDRGIPAVLNSWLAAIAPSCGERNVRRFKQLIDLATQYPYDGGDLGTFVSYVREKRVEDVASARVRVMTIHASKGQQFDAVILPDLDATIASQPASVYVGRDGLLEEATCITTAPNSTVRQFDQRLIDLDVASRTRQTVEELCTLYVAMTRAKQGLEMIVHPRKPTKAGDVSIPKSGAGIICGALLGEAPIDASAIVWNHEGSMVVDGVGEAPAAKAQATGEPVRVSIRTGGSGRNRPEVTPSSLEGGDYKNLGATLDFGADRSRDRGNIVHACFEQVGWLEDGLPSDATLNSLFADGAIANDAAIVKEFRAACAKPNLSKLLKRSSYEGGDVELWRERRFFVRDSLDVRDVTLSGQFDRVVITRASGKPVAAELIDFKSDRVSGRLAELKKTYSPQVRAYRRALSRLLGLEESHIACKLAFIDTDDVVAID